MITAQIRVHAVIVLLAACGGAAPSSAPVAPTAPPSVLARIETYLAPPYPTDSSTGMETFDYRAQDGSPNPPTFSDALVCDVWMLMKQDGGYQEGPQPPSHDDVMSGLGAYLDLTWDNLVGYRPWTNQHFVQGLSEAERGQLADEVQARLAAKQLTCPE